LSQALGPIGYQEGDRCSSATAAQGLSSRPYAAATQSAINNEVSRLLRQAEERAVGLPKDHRSQLGALVDLLLARETVDGSDVYLLAGRRTVPQH
jgi:cell division protease FtsH